jgi:hypothetical protein
MAQFPSQSSPSGTRGRTTPQHTAPHKPAHGSTRSQPPAKGPHGGVRSRASAGAGPMQASHTIRQPASSWKGAMAAGKDHKTGTRRRGKEGMRPPSGVPGPHHRHHGKHWPPRTRYAAGVIPEPYPVNVAAYGDGAVSPPAGNAPERSARNEYRIDWSDPEPVNGPDKSSMKGVFILEQKIDGTWFPTYVGKTLDGFQRRLEHLVNSARVLRVDVPWDDYRVRLGTMKLNQSRPQDRSILHAIQGPSPIGFEARGRIAT